MDFQFLASWFLMYVMIIFWNIFVSISIKTWISWADIYFFAYYFGYHTCVIYRVNQLVIKHLSTQGKLDPRGEFHCFLYPNKTWTPPIGPSSALKIVKKGIRLRKLRPPKVEGSRTQENKPPNTTKAGSQTHTKFHVCH
jgi:hypothetical protein